MIRVGCNFARASRSVANSEYRLRTSRSYKDENCFRSILITTYPGFNCINNIFSSALVALSRINDQNGKLGLLVKYLLDTTGVASLLRPRSCLRARCPVIPVTASIAIILLVTRDVRTSMGIWMTVIYSGGGAGTVEVVIYSSPTVVST
jgi:hypothetical protein